MRKLLKFLFFIIFLIFLMFMYARYVGIKGLKVDEYKIMNNKITDNYHGLKIVQISDIYYGNTIFEEELNNIVNKINLLKPDIVVLTGNLTGNNYDNSIIIEYLSKIEVTIGKYAVTGDDDKNYEEIFEQSNFKNLNNNYELIYKESTPIIISGIDSTDIDIGYKTESYDKYIGQTENKPLFSILLINKPDYIDELNLSNYDLILSGGSLGGNINLPYIKTLFLNDGNKKYYNDYYKLNNVDLFVNSGIGVKNIKLRFLNRPTINFFRITNK